MEKHSKHLLVLLAVISLIFATVLCDEAVVETENGAVRGVVGENYRGFLGIPYTAPPVGDLRWREPAPVKSWKPAVLNATEWKPGCPQICFLPQGACPDKQSEDCVYLNIYTPRTSKLNQSQPVIVFLPGGHFEQGSAGVELYDGRYFVARSNVILVTVSSRLGALGWVVDAKKGINGNYGFLDQRAALQWVQRNIKAFGGDPNSVTLCGQSAGATAAAAHMISPGSKGLFHKIIIQSNPTTLHMRTTKDASLLGEKFTSILGCKNEDCLRSKTAAEIVHAQHESTKGGLPWKSPLTAFLPWTPTVDYKDIYQQTLDAFAQGNFTKMPIIYGSLSEEALLFVHKAMNSSLNEFMYYSLLIKVFRLHAPKVHSLYPGKSSPTGDRREILSTLGTDYIFTAPNRNSMVSIAKHNGANGAYLFYFNHSLSFDCWGDDFGFCRGHACHGAELPIVFHPPVASKQFNKDEEKMSNLMIDYWTNFARTGDPNRGSATVTDWPAFTAGTLRHMEFRAPESRAGSNWKSSYCDYFDKIGYHWGWKDDGF